MDSHLLSDQFSWFVTPFEWNENMSENPDWERCVLHPHDSCFFPYVQHFFTCNSEKDAAPDLNGCIMYKLVSNGFEKFFRHRFQCEIGSEPAYFKFEHNFNDILSPHIFLFPLSSICIFTFALKYEAEQLDVEKFALFNHHLKNLSSGQSSKITPAAGAFHPRALQEYTETVTRFSEKTLLSQNSLPIWTISMLVDFLTKSFRKRYFNERLNVFSFYQTENNYPDLEFRRDLYRITRAYDFNYLPNQELLENGNTIIQPFKNIYFSASIEGAAIALNIDKATSPVFLQNFGDQTVRARYLWIYLLAFLQRSALISMTNSITRLYARSEEPSRDDLIESLSILSKIQLKTIFSEVSGYSQHNDFYEFCRIKMNTQKLTEDLQEKLREIDRIVSYKTEENNKKKERIEAAEKELKNAQQSRREKLLSLILGGVFIPSMWFSLLTSPYFAPLNSEAPTFKGFSFFGLVPHPYFWHIATLLSLFLFISAIYISVREFLKNL